MLHAMFNAMKILFVNNFRGRGGGEEFLRDLLPGLVKQGVKVGLVCRPNTPLVEMFSGSGVEAYPVKRNGIDGIFSVFKIAKIIRNTGYEIISIQRGHDIFQSWVASLLSIRKTTLTYTVQVPEFLKSRFLLRRMDKITTISRYIAEKITTFDPYVSKKVQILYYGIDLTKFRTDAISSGWLRNRFALSPVTKVIATVGDLWKNQIEFLDAFAEIRREIPGTRFAIVGLETGYADVDIFKHRAAELGIGDAVLWVGRLSKDDMLRFYADVDLAVSTHRNEGFGIWVLEALAMGTPVVSVNAGGIRDSLESCPAGVLVDDGPSGMATTVVRIIKDDSLRAGMSKAGPRWIADRFSKERMIEDYLRFFESLGRA
jgi:glycosyltransferase involved in cell wall biosynthesis